MTKGVWLIKLFGVPIIIGVVCGFLLPGFAFGFAPVASGILFALLYITLVDLDLRPRKVSSVALIEGMSIVLFSYFLIPVCLILMTRLLAIDARIETSLILAAMAPFALVAPMFAHNCGGKAALSLWQVLISMILCPFFIPFILWISQSEMPVFVRPLVLYLGVISLGPYLLGLMTQKIFPHFTQRIGRHKSMMASILLAILIYVLFGSAVHKWDAWHSPGLIAGIVFFHIFSDFVLFFLTFYILRKSLGRENAMTYAVTLGMKNMAIPAGLLLAYDPSMAFIPALGFVVHAFFFNFLGLRKGLCH